ncbi:MAG TPA: CBS domain-containing protein [Acidimicrobiales bacterium]|nr:CBS domain-containing protein [Acidimicrobiales bacterium]
MGLIRPDDPVRVLMSTPAASADPNVSLFDLAATLEAEGVGAVTLMTADHLDGVVSERDIVRALAAGCDPADVWAADVMAGEPLYADLDDPIVIVAERMLDQGVRHMPVVQDGRVLGVVSMRDALRVFTEAWRRGSEDER